MRKLIITIILAMTFMATTNYSMAQNQNSSATKVLEISDFNAIKISGGVSDVKYTQGESVEASIHCSPDILKYLDVKVSKKTLIITVKGDEGVNFSRGEFIVTASSPNLNNININGGGHVEIAQGLTSNDKVSFIIVGAGRVDCTHLTAQKLIMNISGAGNIICNKIDSPEMNATVAGVGSIESKSVNSTSVVTNVRGLGVIKLSGIDSDKIKAGVRGEGKIELAGVVRLADYFISGLGNIEAVELMAKDVVAIADGPGTIKCFATDVLDAKSSEFVGGVKYKGNPKLKSDDKNAENIMNHETNTFNLPVSQ